MIDVEKALPRLEAIHKEHLESDIASLIARRFSLNAADALALYFRSRLSREIAAGAYGIQNLDAACLFDDLLENEAYLFEGLS